MLKVENVYKAYKNKKVLKGVNFSLKEGEIKGLIGVNGAGKSTLIELVCGVKKIDSGKIYLNNLDIESKQNKLPIKFVFGYMPQSFSLFNDLTVSENLRYLCSVYKLDEEKEVKRVLKLCKLEEVSNVLASHLSGGYRQLLSLAGALIHSPKLLILDEPTSSMDPLFRKNFWKIIKDCDSTILVITHYMEELLKCDSFACLSNGKIVYDGKLSSFKSFQDLDIETILEKYAKEG